MSVDELLNLPPWSLDTRRKDRVLTDLCNELTGWHAARCPAYRRILDAVAPDGFHASTLSGVPWLPVGLFKSHKLASVPDSEIAVTLTSSGTTGQQPSRIFLDKTTARRQTLALAHTMTGILGPERLPMIVVDTKSVVGRRDEFSARTAGVLGMLNFGRNQTFALNDNMDADIAALSDFLGRHGGAPFFLFGFTFIVWKYFVPAVEQAGLDLSNGILVHSGGWKRMTEIAVTPAEFRRRLRERTGLQHVYNFYGMVEQVGGIFLEGSDGFFHTTNFSDVIIRDPRTWKPAAPGTPGVIQAISALPLSYPGHSILTEDLGVLHADDNPECAWRGRAFSVLGRVPRAEIRGCSDTFAQKAA